MGKNQHKPRRKPVLGLLMHFYSRAFHIAPDKDIQEHLRRYYELGLTDVKVTEALKQHYDTDRYGLRYVSTSLIMSTSYNHQCFYCSKTAEGVGNLIDPPTKAYATIHL